MKKYLLSALIFFIILLFGEIYLKKKIQVGYQTHYTGLQFVDSLIIMEDYRTDSNGNYVLSYLLTDTLKKIYNRESCQSENSAVSSRIANTDGVNQVLKDFCQLKFLEHHNSEFEVFYKELIEKSSYSKADSAYLSYFDFPFNTSGFRSIAFETYETDKKKVLIVGDSFVWGMSAQPYYNSFADILSARNYQIFNAGIASVDPIQYYHIIEEYLEIIDPDLVIINFYEGNDIIASDRIHQEGYPHEYVTNAGFFEANPEGIHLSAQDAYDYYEQALRIPNDNLINKILRKTAIGSLTWTLLNPNKRYNSYGTLSQEERITLTTSYMHKIDSLLNQNNTKHFYAITPSNATGVASNSQISLEFEEELAIIFQGMNYYVPQNLLYSDYNEPYDFHFNNSGSLKYANFIDSLIQNAKFH